jgi:hypothetical protein
VVEEITAEVVVVVVEATGAGEFLLVRNLVVALR